MGRHARCASSVDIHRKPAIGTVSRPHLMGRRRRMSPGLAGIVAALLMLPTACTPTQVGGDPAGQPVPDVTPTPDHILITGRGDEQPSAARTPRNSVWPGCVQPAR